MYALVDCNNFYASCERVFRPDLNNKPIVVLSNNDGCVIARSNEAKTLGIPMGAPAFKYKYIFDNNNIFVFSSNYALYGDISARVMNLLSAFAPEIEIYSIDEAFLEFKDFNNFDFISHGIEMKNIVKKYTGIPISVGFAPTKALAKTANKIAKKFPDQTSGVYIIDSEEKRIKALKWLKVEDIWGIGRQYSKLLKRYKINTAYDFTKQPDEWIQKKLTIVGLKLKHDLEGKSEIILEHPKEKKNIATTRSFNKNYKTIEELSERVSTFATSCAKKLRKQKSNCNALLVFITTNRHREELEQYSNSVIVKLPFPSNSDLELSKFALLGLKKIFIEGYEYKKAGVIVMDFTPINAVQVNLFQNSDPRHKSLMKAIDEINNGIGSIKPSIQDPKRTWKMRQEKLSPRYTTNLNEIIVVNV